MSTTFKLTIITPEREVLNQDVMRFSCESQKGQFEILPDYESSLIVIVPSTATIRDDKGKVSKLFVSSGLLKAKKDEVILCVNAAEWPKDIDMNRAKEAKERAEKRLSSKNNNEDLDVKRAEIALIRAFARMETVEAKIEEE